MNTQFFPATTYQARRSLPRFGLMVAVTLASVLVLIVSLAMLNHQQDIDTGSYVARCDRLAQIVSNRNVSSDINSRSPQWRRARNAAFETCMENPQAFERMVAAL